MDHNLSSNLEPLKGKVKSLLSNHSSNGFEFDTQDLISNGVNDADIYDKVNKALDNAIMQWNQLDNDFEVDDKVSLNKSSLYPMLYNKYVPSSNNSSSATYAELKYQEHLTSLMESTKTALLSSVKTSANGTIYPPASSQPLTLSGNSSNILPPSMEFKTKSLKQAIDQCKQGQAGAYIEGYGKDINYYDASVHTISHESSSSSSSSSSLNHVHTSSGSNQRTGGLTLKRKYIQEEGSIMMGIYAKSSIIQDRTLLPTPSNIPSLIQQYSQNIPPDLLHKQQEVMYPSTCTLLDVILSINCIHSSMDIQANQPVHTDVNKSFFILEDGCYVHPIYHEQLQANNNNSRRRASNNPHTSANTGNSNNNSISHHHDSQPPIHPSKNIKKRRNTKQVSPVTSMNNNQVMNELISNNNNDDGIKCLSTTTLQSLLQSGKIQLGKAYAYCHHFRHPCQDEVDGSSSNSNGGAGNNSSSGSSSRAGDGMVGCCTHYIALIDVQYTNRHYTEALQDTIQPIYQCKHTIRSCDVCLAYSATKVTYNDRLCYQNPTFFCDVCYHMLHYTRNIAMYSSRLHPSTMNQPSVSDNHLDYNLLYDDFDVYTYKQDMK